MNIIFRMDQLILKQQTGTLEEFARKLGRKRSAVCNYIGFMRSMGAPVEYCPYKCSYYYNGNGHFFIGWLE